VAKNSEKACLANITHSNVKIKKKGKSPISSPQLWRASVFPPRTIKPEIFPPPTLKTVRFTSLTGFGQRVYYTVDCYSNSGFVFFFFIYFG
jgi:hypothetical protein